MFPGRRIADMDTLIRQAGVILTVFVTCQAVSVDYFPTKCNGQASITTSHQLETSTGLRYDNNMACTYTVTAASNKRVLIEFQRFDFEQKQNGGCVDYVNVHDGSDVTAVKLNKDPLCGTMVPSNYNTSGQSVTVSMVTDDTGVYRGSGILFTAIYDGPCISSDLSCNNSVCISEDLACNGLDQCGDNSDEASCSSADLLLKYGTDNAPMIAGIVLGILVAITIALVIGVYVYKRNKWKRFLNETDQEDDSIWEVDSAYPVTHRYFKGHRGRPNYNTLQAERDHINAEISDVTARDTQEKPGTSTSTSTTA